ncbi:hypothetical protein CHS0354_037914 [Potamilus streckersoni]|uniref:Uncharacterized protein n=1 Tax=Potamilus streckersoni TaxID=2493646 RepID=A0AAE0W9P5_9BIVA|nr:hypothetical protein CHS0354_037914 [Potamilus streckersoni]
MWEILLGFLRLGALTTPFVYSGDQRMLLICNFYDDVNGGNHNPAQSKESQDFKKFVFPQTHWKDTLSMKLRKDIEF